MAEQRLERKRLRAIGRVLRWISIGFLTLLLALMLIFQAPWKITVLLAVFLAGCTALPKPLRKWFRLPVGAVILLSIIWVFAPEDNEGWRPYTFDTELAAIEAKYAIPDEENAALAYDAIFKTLDIDSNQPEFFLKSKPSSINEPWLSKDHPEMVEWLKGHQDTIAKLLQAARKEKCHFPIPPYSWNIGQHTERLSPMRKCAFLLVSAGNNDLGEGRIDAGLEKYVCVIRMANHLYQQPVAIDFVAASGLESLALTRLNRFVVEGGPTSEQLQLVSDSVGNMGNNWGSEFKKMLEPDKLFIKNDFLSMVYEVNPQGKVRFSRDPLAAFRGVLHKELPTPTYSKRLLYKANAMLAWLGMPPTPQKPAEILDACFDNHYAMAEPDFDWAKHRQKFDSLSAQNNLAHIKLNFRYIARLMVDVSQGAYFSPHDAYLRSLAMRRGSRALVALRQYHNQHGTWPDSLDSIRPYVPAEALVDPQNNGSYVYGLTQDSFRLYSRGPNGKDEEGHYKQDGPDDLSIWPRRQ